MDAIRVRGCGRATTCSTHAAAALRCGRHSRSMPCHAMPSTRLLYSTSCYTGIRMEATRLDWFSPGADRDPPGSLPVCVLEPMAFWCDSREARSDINLHHGTSDGSSASTHTLSPLSLSRRRDAYNDVTTVQLTASERIAVRRPWLHITARPLSLLINIMHRFK